MKIKITKLKELEDARHPNNIEEGFETIQIVDENSFWEPKIGYRFNVGNFSSSKVVEIIDGYTFKTSSSIYRWEIVL